MEFKYINTGSDQYSYDANGRMTSDLNKKINKIEYNFLHLPLRIDQQDGNRMEYLYDATGVKQQVKTYLVGKATLTRDYRANKIYENNVLKMVLTEDGYVEPAGSSFNYYFYIKDHLGNHRMVADRVGTVVQATNYYPFGLSFAENPARTDQDKQPYKFNGKELDRAFGWDAYDYGARTYNPAIGRFLTPDPMCEKYYSISPYAYCGNNPVNRVDIDGRIDIDVKTQQKYPQLTEYLKNLSQEWKNKSESFKTAFKETSGLNDKQVTEMLEFGKGPKLVVKELDIKGETNGETYFKDIGKGKVENEGKGNIALDNDVAGMMENAQTAKDKDVSRIMVESTTFHELTHVGIATTSNTPHGKYKESGKAFETKVYGKDISRSNVAAYRESIQLKPIPIKIIPLSIP